MSRRHWPAAWLAFAVGLAGAWLGAVNFGLDLEERFGLDALFLLRGVQPPPGDVVVVSIDKDSADFFGLPNEPRKWPRELHAQLINGLSRSGVSAIGFDINFEEQRDPVQDRQLEQAVRLAGNVVLLEFLRKDTVMIEGVGGQEAVLERLVPPWPALELAAAATAPFPLPKVPVKVSRYWLFKDGAGDAPTLPMTLYQMHMQQHYASLRRALVDALPEAASLPMDMAMVRQQRQLRTVLERLRQWLRQESVSRLVSVRLAADPTLTSAARQQVMSLARVYQESDSRTLNFYGPPRTITTLPYHKTWQAVTGKAPSSIDLRNKVVLVGFSERRQPEQKDSFYSVYSQEASGLDISGVEIAATALANMIEDRPVRMLNASSQFGLLLVWGWLVGGLAMSGRAVWSVAGVLGLMLMYFLAVQFLFDRHVLWWPLIIPLMIQAPVALFASAWWRYREAAHERNRIRQAFRHYLPEQAVQRLARDLRATPGGELMQGVCLATDAAHYTALAEQMAPDVLARFMNRYYESLFQPVREHGGFVSDVVGDAMLAVWAEVQPDARQRAQACRAALAMQQADGRFSRENNLTDFKTRIGLHAGPILLGNIGTADHLEYRAVGDIVNTASRLQALNKNLGTRLLASAETVAEVVGLVTRPLGSYRLRGKTQPVVVVEILGEVSQPMTGLDRALSAFSAALALFQACRFEEAAVQFEAIAENFPEDGPSQFYARLARQMQASASVHWDGVISMSDLPRTSAVVQ